MKMVYDVKTEDEFQTLISVKKTTIVEFYANWCPPCLKIGPIVEEHSKIYTDIQFLRVDIDLLDDLVVKEDIQAMPTFMVYDSGKTTGLRLLGADPDALLDLIKSVSHLETSYSSVITGNDSQKERVSVDNAEKKIKDSNIKKEAIKENKCIII